MSLRKLSTRSRVAISKAQQSTGVVVPDLANRVTALEQEDQAINIDLNALFINDAAQDSDIAAVETRANDLEYYNTQGYSGTITLVATVNFVAQTLTTKTLTYINGKLTEVV